VRFVVTPLGTAIQAHIVESTGHSALDAAALDAVAHAAPFPAPTVPTEVTLPIVFALR
jgi:TonB family protein